MIPIFNDRTIERLILSIAMFHFKQRCIHHIKAIIKELNKLKNDSLDLFMSSQVDLSETMSKVIIKS